jgi:hypothetical protein
LFERPESSQEVKLPMDEIFTYQPKAENCKNYPHKQELEEVKKNNESEEHSNCENDEEGNYLRNPQMSNTSYNSHLR